MSEERIKPRADGGGRRILCSRGLAQEQSRSRARRRGRGISRTCLGWPAPVSHHLTGSRRQSLAQQPGDIRPTGDAPRAAQATSPGKHRPGAAGPFAGLLPGTGARGGSGEGLPPEITKLLHVYKRSTYLCLVWLCHACHRPAPLSLRLVFGFFFF